MSRDEGLDVDARVGNQVNPLASLVPTQPISSASDEKVKYLFILWNKLIFSRDIISSRLTMMMKEGYVAV